MITGEGHQIVIIGVTSFSNNRLRVGSHISDSSNRGHVEPSQLGLDALLDPRPAQDIFYLGEQRWADHHLETAHV